MSEAVGVPPTRQVVYISGGARRNRKENKAAPEEMADRMNAICRGMESQGLRLLTIVPYQRTSAFQGTWTEGVWLFFTGE